MFSKVSVLLCRKCCLEHLVKEDTNEKVIYPLIKSLVQQNRLCIVCSAVRFTLLLVDAGQAVHHFHGFGFKSQQNSLALAAIGK